MSENTYFSCKLMRIKLRSSLLIKDFLIWSFKYYINIILSSGYHLFTNNIGSMSVTFKIAGTRLYCVTWYSRITDWFFLTSSWKQSRALSGKSKVNSTPKTDCDINKNADKYWTNAFEIILQLNRPRLHSICNQENK